MKQNYSDLFELSMTKTHQTQLRIVRGAMKVYATKGIIQGTLKDVSKASKVSMRLVQYYFKDHSNLVEWCGRLIVSSYEDISKVNSLKKMTLKSRERSRKRRVEAWAKKYPDQFRVFLLLKYLSVLPKKYCPISEGLARNLQSFKL